MSTHDNPKLLSRITPAASGSLYIDRQVTDLGDPVQVPPIANGDLLQIGVVPAGSKLVPRLSRLALPEIDSNAAPSGTASFGTATVAAALINSGSVGAPVTKLQPDFKDAEIGSATDDTPLYLTFTAALATQAATGKIVFDAALRAWDTVIDD